MTFDIRALDDVDSFEGDYDERLAEYRDALLELFFESPEAEEHRKTYRDIGYWIANLIYYGYVHAGATIPRMTVRDVDEIVTEIFPRKISLTSREEAKDAVPELIAFWEYLKREYKLGQADGILKFLREISPDEFVKMMYDSSKFGMAKSFFMAGQSAGFDMTDEKESQAFMLHYNASLLADRESKPGGLLGPPKQKKRDAAKQKRKRKAARAARKRGRKKRK